MQRATDIVSRRIVGIANQGLTPEKASTLGAALGTHLGPDSVVVTCRDFRSDSRMVKRAFASGLMSTGIDVLDLHATSLPILQFALKRFGASAGV
ncbi:MAG: phosphoglucomutase, partial [Candidatus Thorarchaeota archaeon]